MFRICHALLLGVALVCLVEGIPQGFHNPDEYDCPETRKVALSRHCMKLPGGKFMLNWRECGKEGKELPKCKVWKFDHEWCDMYEDTHRFKCVLEYPDTSSRAMAGISGCVKPDHWSGGFESTMN